jgi:hypothetical protein
MSELDAVEHDHHLLVQLRWRLESAADPRVRGVLVATVARHLSAAGQYLYPAARRLLPDGPAAVDRIAAADAVLLRSGDLDVAEHLRLCGELLARLRATQPADELVRLDNRLQIAREAAPTRPHPGLPRTPPLNKIFDPVVGVVDKVRDAVTRRTTWPEDLWSAGNV